MSLSILTGLCALGFDGSIALPNLTPVENLTRVEHAKEILGRGYTKSVVKKSEQDLHLDHFILEQTQSALKGPWAAHSWTVAETIIEESRKYSVDPVFLMAVINHESRFNPAALGSHGEIGLMQIKPDTAEWVAKKFHLNIKMPIRQALQTPEINIRIGAAYLSMLRKKYGANSDRYLAAYNMGTTSLRHALERRLKPIAYSSKVKKHYVHFYKVLATLN